jgi:hypothetical protein
MRSRRKSEGWATRPSFCTPHAVREKETVELERDLAGQVYAVSVVASKKHRYTTRAYLAVLVFLVLWVVARVALALTLAPHPDRIRT